MVPADADQTTRTFDVLRIRAVNCSDPRDCNVPVSGVIFTTTPDSESPLAWDIAKMLEKTIANNVNMVGEYFLMTQQPPYKFRINEQEWSQRTRAITAFDSGRVTGTTSDQSWWIFPFRRKRQNMQ